MAKRLTIFGAALLVLGLTLTSARAQESNIDFGGLRADPSLAIEVTSDSFTIDQASHSATFSGSVRVAQGEMVMTASEVVINYAENGGSIVQLVASGGVILKAGSDAAQPQSATYIIANAEVTLTGDVLLTQGSAAISGQKLTVNLTNGTGRIEGRVTTTFIPGSN